MAQVNTTLRSRLPEKSERGGDGVIGAPKLPGKTSSPPLGRDLPGSEI
jgi:hypothetical protein